MTTNNISAFILAAERLVVDPRINYAVMKFDTVLDELIAQLVWNAQEENGGVSPLSLLEQFLAAAQKLESFCTELQARLVDGEEKKPHSEIVEALWLMRSGVVTEFAIPYTYNSHYGTYLTFYADGHVEVEDEGEEFHWTPADGVNSGVTSLCDRIYRIVEEISAILRGMPWGNLWDFGGRRAIIDALLTADAARAYAKPLQEAAQEK